jgi:hypothetical protein
MGGGHTAWQPRPVATMMCSPMHFELAYCYGVVEVEGPLERLALLGISLFMLSSAFAWMVLAQSRRSEGHLTLSAPF